MPTAKALTAILSLVWPLCAPATGPSGCALASPNPSLTSTAVCLWWDPMTTGVCVNRQGPCSCLWVEIQPRLLPLACTPGLTCSFPVSLLTPDATPDTSFHCHVPAVCPGPCSWPWSLPLFVCLLLASSTKEAPAAHPYSCVCAYHWPWPPLLPT